ncbi:hypothetical protein [Halopseudomonas aestusnigri]|jgi:hypothetical protein|uniref:hypothetical protein n=1 Tax=Halopseudomonas aestusnigri TaxID=857252 RepID=UPI0030028FA1
MSGYIRLDNLLLGLAVFLSVLIVSLSNSFGYDFYSHVRAYGALESLGFLYKSYSLEGVVFPRYVLLSVVYELLSVFGVPFGWFFVFVKTFLVIRWACFFQVGQGKFRIFYIAIHSFFALLLSFYYSGLSLALMFFVVGLVSRDRLYYLGLFFHPLGVLLFIVLAVFKLISIGFAVLVICAVSAFFLIGPHAFPWMISFSPSVNDVDLSSLAVDVVFTKWRELSLFFIFLFFLYRRREKLNASVVLVDSASRSLVSKDSFCFLLFFVIGSLALLGLSIALGLQMPLVASAEVEIMAWGFDWFP